MKFVLVITYMTLGWIDWEVKGMEKIEGFTNPYECQVQADIFNQQPHTSAYCMRVK